MKKILSCLLIGACTCVTYAQDTSKTIALFGHTLSCDNGIKTGHLLITDCVLPNSPWNERLKIKIINYDGTIQPTQKQVEEFLGNDEEQEKFLFFCRRTNRIIGGALSSHLPFEWIAMSTPSFLMVIEHATTKQSFSSKNYLNQLCQWTF